MTNRATCKKNSAVSCVYWIFDMLIPFPFPLFISVCLLLQYFSHSFAVSFVVPESNRPMSLSPSSQKQLHLLYVLCLRVSIYPSPPLWGFLRLSLVSPLLWLVSVVSVRTVIAAVTSLGENKVVLCSWHHKRHKRKEPQPKRIDGKSEKLKEVE